MTDQPAHNRRDAHEPEYKQGTRKHLGAGGSAGAAKRSRDKLLAKLDAEVRSTLQSIVGAVSLLLNSSLTAEQREYVAYVSDAARDLENAVNRATSELTELAGAASSRSTNSVEQILATVMETLGMEVSFVSRFTEDRMMFRALEGDARSFGWREGEGVPLEKTFCKRVVEGLLPNVIPDAKNDEHVNRLDITREADIGSYVGLPLRFSDGRVYGTLCCLSHSANPRLRERDKEFMQVLARLVADQLEREELEAENRRLETRAAGVSALLDALATHDDYTEDHVQAVVEYSVAVARQIGLSEAEVIDVEQAAALHDIGKLGIAEAILYEPGSLSSAAWEDIRKHSVMGEEIVSSTKGLSHLAPVIRAVHERWDGKGYPDGLSGAEIPLASRIISVCDAFDAMTSHRPYRRALDVPTALEELKKNAGVQFCSLTVEAFLDVLGSVGEEDG